MDARAKDESSHGDHMARASLARAAAAGVASDHLGGCWTAAAAFFRSNLARSEFIRVKFGHGRSAEVPAVLGPAARAPPPLVHRSIARSREGH